MFERRMQSKVFTQCKLGVILFNKVNLYFCLFKVGPYLLRRSNACLLKLNRMPQIFQVSFIVVIIQNEFHIWNLHKKYAYFENFIEFEQSVKLL